MTASVRAPEVCETCAGDGFVRVAWIACPDCRCVVCGARTDVIGGECGQCATEADVYWRRRTDR